MVNNGAAPGPAAVCFSIVFMPMIKGALGEQDARYDFVRALIGEVLWDYTLAIYRADFLERGITVAALPWEWRGGFGNVAAAYLSAAAQESLLLPPSSGINVVDWNTFASRIVAAM